MKNPKKYMCSAGMLACNRAVSSVLKICIKNCGNRNTNSHATSVYAMQLSVMNTMPFFTRRYACAP